jgi:hypothetical protein
VVQQILKVERNGDAIALAGITASKTAAAASSSSTATATATARTATTKARDAATPSTAAFPTTILIWRWTRFLAEPECLADSQDSRK